MKNHTPHDPNLPFDQIVDEIKRVHQSRRSHSGPRHSRPRPLSAIERTRRVRWVFGTLLALAAGIVIAVLAPT